MPVRLHINAVGVVMGGGVTHLSPFVKALAVVRPEWEVVLYRSLNGPNVDSDFAETRDVTHTSWRRIRWDAVTVGRVASANGADVLLNVANYGPLRSRIPSILYQRNALYFDPSWVKSMGSTWRAKASIRRRLAFAQMHHSAAVVVPSHAMASFLRSWHNHPESVRIEVVPHGVDISRFRFSSGRPRATGGPLRLVALGHAAPHKGQELLLDLMTELRTRGIDAVLDATIADDDDREYVGMLRNRVREAGLQDIVRFVGRVTGFRFLADADIMISPSTSESFGFPLIEAMASGVPVVATSIPATKELLGSFGWYFPIGNASLAADQVIAICESDPVDLMVRLEGARKVAAGFSWEINAEYIARLAEEVMGARDD